jgi:hypothetical protein
MRTKAVISGKKLCDDNGGDVGQHVDEAVINTRDAAGIGRMCPCGEKLVIQAAG